MKIVNSFAFLLLCLVCSCSSLTRINVSMLEPGAVSFDPEVRTVVLLNRAVPPNTKANKIESYVTGEGQQQDKQGRQQILAGIHQAMLNSPNLKCILTDFEYAGSGTGTLFPAVLGWDTVAKLCRDNHAEALIALETYDSDCIVTHESGQVQVNNQFGIPIPSVQIFVTQKIVVKVGFRIYDLKNKTILDQYNYTYHRTFNSQARSLGEIMTGLLNRQEAISKTSYDAGIYFKSHISPTWANEIRYLYKKSGGSPMAIGSRQAMVGNWNEAKENWQKVLNGAPKRKLAGRASYNLALACEVTGDLDGARDWISKSYGNFNNSRALYYQNTINRRYQAVSKLDQQMR